MKNQRTISPGDQFIAEIGTTLETLFAPATPSRPYPAKSREGEMDQDEKRRSAGFMRVNHVGEICAQALYQSQALTSSNPKVAETMRSAAQEETDHLAWCETRLGELGAGKSLLNPVWYAGSFALGAMAGIAGDKWNLGFVAETEQQVVNHLESHLATLPEKDIRSREIVEQMKQDEAEHAEMAIREGAAELPQPVRWLMRQASKVMTRTAYWI